jgi:DNA-binding phage protein
MIKSTSYEAQLIEALRDPTEAAEYLTAALADGDNDVFCSRCVTSPRQTGESAGCPGGCD